MAGTTLRSASLPSRRTAPGLPPGGRLLHAVFVYGLLLLLSAVILLPISWMVTAALKPDTAPVFTYPPEWFPTRYFRLETFYEALFRDGEPYLLFAFNSFVLVAVNICGAVISNSLIAYPFARLRFRGRDVLFTLLVATMLLPAPVLLIPQFLLFFNLGWYGTYLPLTVPSFFGNAFFVFLLRQYMRTIPRELDEAARIDGASYWQIFRHVIVPLTLPALTVVAVFTFLGTWNDFFGPLIYIDDPGEYTIALALANEVSRFGTEWNILMAANLIAIIPPLIVYFLSQKRLIGGISSVGIRG
jgi:multiple sugar transport system permease protein